MESVVDALRPFLLSVTAVLMIIVLNVAFAIGPLADVTVALATAMFAFTFAFADLAKNTLSSFQFLFIRQPFDIGDRVEVGRPQMPSVADWVAGLSRTCYLAAETNCGMHDACMHARTI